MTRAGRAQAPSRPAERHRRSPPAGARHVGRAGLRLGTASGLGLGTAVLWLSLLVLHPARRRRRQGVRRRLGRVLDAITRPARSTRCG